MWLQFLLLIMNFGWHLPIDVGLDLAKPRLFFFFLDFFYGVCYFILLCVVHNIIINIIHKKYGNIIVGVVGLVVRIYVYIGLGVQFENIR